MTAIENSVMVIKKHTKTDLHGLGHFKKQIIQLLTTQVARLTTQVVTCKFLVRPLFKVQQWQTNNT